MMKINNTALLKTFLILPMVSTFIKPSNLRVSRKIVPCLDLCIELLIVLCTCRFEF